MANGSLRKKAIPYYACYAAQLMAKESPETVDGLATKSRETILENGVIGQRERLADRKILDAALAFLTEEKIIQFLTDEFGPGLVVRTEGFSDNLKRLHSEKDTVFYKYALAGEKRATWLSSALHKINEQLEHLGEQNDESEELITSERGDFVEEEKWTPLPIERESIDFKEAISSAEKALETIEQNNGYASTEPDERNAIVRTVGGTLTALKEGRPSLASVKEGLLKPLRYVATKFSDSVMGEFAKIAVSAILKWLAGL